ncbi:plasmid partitioning protein RepB C-terminal domain-containing protein [Mesorhizobium sp. ES1-1]|uniref:plasmid partitioning protein RepB C-terminal domain-containing protein n=1 Tax=Mesorhizobium sp. ES1-1 TaxID=2876629 RepID=UPI001CC9A5D1|nr:plasmid partitioning protein RepB C-terminal domain-containing protein [Mesorhizobium sp. ES1-1]MBZ9678283.1 hypothetical protein [Mesorhizobium sp. ES1-1]
MALKRLAKDEAYLALANGGNRHATNIAAGHLGSRPRVFAPDLLATFEAESTCMRAFISEAKASEWRLGQIVAALRLVTRDIQFRELLVSEGFLTIPTLLAHRLHSATRGPQAHSPAKNPPSGDVESRQLVGGICPDAIDLLRDIPVKPKMFGLLQKVLPVRQLEIVRLMVVLDRVGLTFAKMLIALTPKAMLVEGFRPTTVATLTQEMREAMTLELERLSAGVLKAAEQHGRATLELIAASHYFDRLMDNSKIVRYLARNFSGHFEEFHNLTATSRS